MTTAKWTINHTREQQDLHYPAAIFNEKECLWVVGGGDALTPLGQQIGRGLLIVNHLDQSL
jgi:hypothetical protein